MNFKRSKAAPLQPCISSYASASIYSPAILECFYKRKREEKAKRAPKEDFTERVAQTKIPQGMSPEVFKCIQFISHHINEPIQVGDVAEHIGRSRSYLTNKFKKELGFDVSRFIMRCRLEEAKSLLTYSDKTLSEISTYLCFSSQSYFQNIFKKKYGITPLKYRKQTQKA